MFITTVSQSKYMVYVRHLQNFVSCSRCTTAILTDRFHSAKWRLCWKASVSVSLTAMCCGPPQTTPTPVSFVNTPIIRAYYCCFLNPQTQSRRWRKITKILTLKWHLFRLSCSRTSVKRCTLQLLLPLLYIIIIIIIRTHRYTKHKMRPLAIDVA